MIAGAVSSWPGSDRVGDQPLRCLMLMKAPAVGTTQPGLSVEQPCADPGNYARRRRSREGTENKETTVRGHKLDTIHPHGWEDWSWFHLGKQEICSGKLMFCLSLSKPGGSLSLFVPQMGLELASQLKYTKLAKLVTHFPKNAHWLCCKWACFQKFSEVYRFQFLVMT